MGSKKRKEKVKNKNKRLQTFFLAIVFISYNSDLFQNCEILIIKQKFRIVRYNFTIVSKKSQNYEIKVGIAFFCFLFCGRIFLFFFKYVNSEYKEKCLNCEIVG